MGEGSHGPHVILPHDFPRSFQSGLSYTAPMNDPRPPHVFPTQEFGKGEALQMRLGIDPISGPLLSAIVIFGANIEYFLEDAIWNMRGVPIPPKPDTDVRISDRLKLFDLEVAKIEEEERRKLLETWSKAVKAGFIIRNNIVHGVTIPYPSGGTTMMRNPGWNGVKRKQPFGSFDPDVHVLRMTRDSFATLFRIIHAIAVGKLDRLDHLLAGRAVREARSMLGEFADHTYGPSFEKY